MYEALQLEIAIKTPSEADIEPGPRTVWLLDHVVEHFHATTSRRPSCWTTITVTWQRHGISPPGGGFPDTYFNTRLFYGCSYRFHLSGDNIHIFGVPRYIFCLSTTPLEKDLSLRSSHRKSHRPSSSAGGPNVSSSCSPSSFPGVQLYPWGGWPVVEQGPHRWPNGPSDTFTVHLHVWPVRVADSQADSAACVIAATRPPPLRTASEPPPEPLYGRTCAHSQFRPFQARQTSYLIRPQNLS